VSNFGTLRALISIAALVGLSACDSSVSDSGSASSAVAAPIDGIIGAVQAVPTVSATFNNGAAYTNSTSVNINMTITDVPTQMYITTTSGCTKQGSWVTYANPAPYTIANNKRNGLVTIYVAVKNASGQVSNCASASITHDDTAPTLAITNPANGVVLTSASNLSAYTMNGTCSENGQTVDITGSVTATATCASGAWSTVVDLTGVADGNLSITATHEDLATNAATVTRTFSKDSTPPTGSFTINGGAAYTTSTAVTLNHNATGASQTYVTNTAGCTAGGSWVTYAASSSWTLPTANAANTVYVKYRDSNNNETACLSQSITHDTIAPTFAVNNPVASSYVISTNAAAFPLDGTCSDNGQNIVISGAASGTATCTAGAWSTTVNISAQPEGALSFTFNYSDPAGNAATAVTRSVTKDTVAPTADLIQINAGAAYTTSSSVNLDLLSSGAVQMYVTQTAGCTAGGSWVAYATTKTWTLTSLNAANTIYVAFKDTAGNVSSCISASIIHDNIPPTLAVANPAASSYVKASNAAAYVINGTCSENGRNVVIGGAISTTVACSAGAFSKTVDLSALADGPLTFTFDHSDAAGQNATTITRNVTKDTVVPSSPTISINSGATYTTSTSVTLTLSSVGADQMYITQTAGCAAGGSWVAYATSSPWTLTTANASNTVYVAYRDLAGNQSSCVSASIIHDGTAPTLTVTTPADNSYISSANAASFSMSGTCSENGRNVVISGAYSTTATCTSGAWSKTVNLGILADGAVSLSFDLSDVAGNAATSVVRNLTKDTSAPVASSIQINSGAAYTNSTSATLTLTAVAADEMYITQTAACASGGTWEAYSASKAWTLGAANGVNNVYVKFRDLAGNLSTCITASITHDNVAPVATSVAINSGASYTNNTSVSLALAATGANEMYVTQTAACTAGGTWETYSTSKSWTLLNSNTSNTVYAQFRDTAGNVSSCISASIIHDNVAPTLAVTSPSNGAYISSNNSASFTVSGTCSENTRNVVISGAVSSSATCTAGAFSKSLDLSSVGDGAVALTFGHLDAAGNAAATVTLNLVKDTVAPTSNSLVINNGDLYTPTQNVTLTLASTGAADMYVTNTAGCSAGGAWEAYATSKAWALPNAEVSNTVYAKFRDAAGNISSCLNASITHDPAPALTISAPDFANIANQAAYTINGTCSPSGRNVSLSGTIVATVACVGGSWTTTQDLTAVADSVGLVINADYSNAGGTAAPQASKTFTKDTLAPIGSISIKGTLTGGVVYTNTTSVKIAIYSDDGVQYYMTNNMACIGGGSWTPQATQYVTDIPWTITQTNAVASVYSQYKDAAGNLSACFVSTITHDNIAPSFAVTNPGASGLVNLYNRSSFNFAGTCDDEGKKINLTYNGTSFATAYCSSGAWSINSSTAVLPEGSSTVVLTMTDDHGNWATPKNVSITKDTISPALLISSPANWAYVGGANQASYPITGTCNKPGSTINITGSISTSTTCQIGNTWTANVNFTAVAEGTLTVYAQMVDSVGNLSPSRGLVLVKDVTAPAISITSMANGTQVTEVDQKISGNCQTGLNVTAQFGSNLTGDAVVPCNGGKFNAFVEVTGGVVGSRTVTYSQTDLAGNSASSAVSFNYVLPVEVKGQINAIAKAADGSIYYGGKFTGYSSQKLGAAMKINSSGVRDSSFNIRSGFDGNVYAVLELPDGSTLFGGDFLKYRGKTAYKLAKINANGDLDLTFNPQVGGNGGNSTVKALALRGSSVYVGGIFTIMKGVAATRIAKIDFNGNVDTSFNLPGVVSADGTVHALTVVGSDLYIAGEFTSYRGTPVSKIARVDADTGALNGTFNAGSFDNHIFSIAYNAGAIYVGGQFMTCQSVAVNGLAKLDANTGAIDSGFSSAGGFSVAPVVYGLAAYGTDIIAVGRFTKYGTNIANNIAKISSAGVLDTTFNPQTGGNGFDDIAQVAFVNGSDIYVGGQFTTYKGAPARRLAKLTSAGALDTVFNPATGTASSGSDGIVNAIGLLQSGDFIVGGGFTSYRSTYVANNILKTDASGNIDTNFNPQSGANGFDYQVRSILIDGSSIYVGGDFTTYRGSTANRFVKMDLDGVADATFSTGTGLNNSVYGAAISGTNLYIVGMFSTYNNLKAWRLAKVDAVTGTLDQTFNNQSGSIGLNGLASAVAVSGNDLYIGGAFTTYKGLIANRIAKIDATSGALDSTFNPQSGANGAAFNVTSLALNGSDIYIGGVFTAYRGTPVNRIAKISSLGVLDTGFNATVGADSNVNALIIANGSLYFTGYGMNYNGSVVNRLAKVNLATGAPDVSFSPQSGGNGLSGYHPQTGSALVSGFAIYHDGTYLYVGGGFTQYRGQRYNYNVRLDSSGVAVP
jgi:hypothetical protein